MENINKFKEEKKKIENTSTLISKLFEETSKSLTENYAVTYSRSGSNLLDFFAQGAAMRNNPDGALELFQKAFSEDKEKAIRILFYFRDIREGQGERTLFRNCLEWLGTFYPEDFEKIVEHIPEYGRWDDMFFNNEKCFSTIIEQLRKDQDTDNPSLLAKWLPTINASSPTTKKKARFMAEKIGISEIAYRQLIRNIRKKIKVVEELMSARKWDEINYSSVPSQAARIYSGAFRKHDEERYNEFINKAEKGEEKIQSGTLYPYQIYKDVINKYSKTLEALWNQLPDYTRGKNAIVVADVSGSMAGTPMSVSVSLALYFAERNKGIFKDHFITFSGKPKLQRIQGETLLQKMMSIERADWDMNTNLQRVFDLILNTAIENNIPQEELPETIYIISDMEFDYCCDTSTNFQVIENKFEEADYKLPNLVFWNVDARSGKNMPVQKGTKGVTLVSGFSPSIFKMVVEDKTPEEIMNDVINSKRYSSIRI